jgi:hypothetical protein
MNNILFDSLFWVRNVQPFWTWIPHTAQVFPCAENLTLVDRVNRTLANDLALFAYAERRLVSMQHRNFYTRHRGRFLQKNIRFMI